jgi:hypothetical protein
MSPGDIISLCTLIVTVLGFMIAFFTYAFTVARNPRLSMVINPKIHLHYTEDNRLILTTDYIFLNGGAQPGVLIELLGTISPIDGQSVNLRWEKFEETENTAKPGNASQYETHSSGWVHPLFVPGRSAGSSGQASTIRLYADAPSALKGANYQLELTGVEGSKLANECKVVCCLHLEQSDTDFLSHYCTEDNGVWENRLIMMREKVGKENTLAGLRRRLRRQPITFTFNAFSDELDHPIDKYQAANKPSLED